MANIRLAQKADIPHLRDLGEQSFVKEFGALYTSENLTEFLKASHSTVFYENLLVDDSLKCWVAEAQGSTKGALLGYVIAGKNTISLKPTNLQNDPARCGELKRLYLEERAKGTGLAQRLMETAMNWLDDQNLKPVTLSVYEDNLRAQKFYQRFGFAKVGEHIFKVGEHLDRDYIYCNQ